MDTIQRYIAQLEREVRDADIRIIDLEADAQGQKVEGKIHIYREVSMIRRRREEAARKLQELHSIAARTAEVAA